MPRNDSLSLFGWSILLTKAALISLGLVVKSVAGLFRNRKALTFHQYIGYTGIRDYQKGLSATDIQNLRPSTSQTCLKYANLHALDHWTIELPDGTTAQWLAPQTRSKVAVVFHGGGYMSPALDQHLFLAFGFAKAPRRDLSAVFLQYDLASENANHYPRQLQQAVSLLKYLINKEQISPSAITLIGDSAGAHLLMSLALHISHPNPLVSALKVQGQFSGAALISPWLDLNSSAESMLSNKGKDILSAAALEYWAQIFLSGQISDYWNAPLTAPTEWLGDLPIDRILVMYGENELLRDDSSLFCDRLKTQIHHPRFQSFAAPDEIHAQMLLNRFLKINKPSQSEKIFTDWMDEKLRSKHEVISTSHYLSRLKIDQRE